MIEDREFEKRFNQFKQKSQTTPHFSGFVKQLLESPHPDSWIILDYLLVTVQAKDKMHFNELRNQIEKAVKTIRSFTMLIYVYSLKITRKDFSFHYVYWKGQFQQVAIGLSEMTIFSSWISNKSNLKNVQECLWLLVKIVPTMIKNESIQFGQLQLKCVIQWVAYFATPDPDKYTDVCQLIKTAKETKFKQTDLHSPKQHILLRKLLQVACQNKDISSNIYLFIYPMLLADKEISSFCEINYQFITDIGQDELLNFFISLTKSAISKQALVMIQKISHLLANQQQYFKLRHLYQHFILPVLAKRAKACGRVQQAVFETSSLYILGFLKHCDIGNQGVQCITKNIGKIKNQKVQQKWIQICALISFRYPQLKYQIIQELKKQLNRPIDLNQGDFHQQIQDPNCVWDISLRSGRKHKRYLKVPSKLRGITNRSNQCYIISSIQGIQRNQLLQNLLDKHRQQIKGRYKLLDQLRILFSEMSGRRKTDNIGVNYLKKLSPDQFIKSLHQQDAYEYLIKLFALMEEQMQNIPNMLNQFKSIYEIDEISTLFCTKCKYTKQTPDKCYILTIPYTAVLSEETEQPLADFACQNCKSPPGTCVMKRKIKPKSQILIIHINRFSWSSDGKPIKQLSTQRILRTFLNYELVGMICHRGKNIERGHYLYYHRLSAKRWAQFNDRLVDEFELQQPYQQFERQWKSEMTPFILFYQLTDKPK